MLPLNPVVRLKEIAPLRSKGAIHNLEKIWRLNAIFPGIPAAVIVPVLHPVQKGRQGNLIVIGQCQPPGGRRIKGRHNGSLCPFQLHVLSKAQQGALQRLSIVGGNGFGLCVVGAHGAHNLRKLFALRIPAQENAISRKLPDPLFRGQPPQRVMCLLGSRVADRSGLPVGIEASPVSKAAGIVGGDQLGIAVDGDDSLGMLGSHRKRFPLDQAQSRISIRSLPAVKPDKSVK